MREPCEPKAEMPSCYAFVWGVGAAISNYDARDLCRSHNASLLYYDYMAGKAESCQDRIRKGAFPAEEVVSIGNWVRA